MEAQLVQFTNKGMKKDLAISKASNEFAYHNSNIRITTVNGEKLLSVTNEQVPLVLDCEIFGRYVGHCLTGTHLVIFTQKVTIDDTVEPNEESSVNYIYKLDCTDDESLASPVLLYQGDLEMSENDVIETLFYYESDDIQKVYWIDGKHQVRVINIMGQYNNDDPTQFDFVPILNNVPTVTINKEQSATGNFHSGTIQYYITYYNKFGAESHIIYSSPIYYISPEDRGGAPDEFCSCSFSIKIEDIDTSFDYIRVYSAKRQSLDGPIELNIVGDLEINDNNSIKIIDNGISQTSLDPTILQFIGGNNLIPQTFAQKDDTLFLGNIKLSEGESISDLREYITNNWIVNQNGFMSSNRISFSDKQINYVEPSGFYPFKSQLNSSSSKIKTFKCGEIYRFAIQYQTKNGEWTQPIWIGDKKCTARNYIDDNNKMILQSAVFTNDNSSEYEELTENFIAHRLLIAETSTSTRSILAQGVVCPTIFNYDERINNKPFSVASYIMRPRYGNAEYFHLYPIKDEIFGNPGNALPENISSSLTIDPNDKKYIKADISVSAISFALGYVEWEIVIDLNFYTENISTNVQSAEVKIGHESVNTAYDITASYNKLMATLQKYGLNDDSFLTLDELKAMANLPFVDMNTHDWIPTDDSAQIYILYNKLTWGYRKHYEITTNTTAKKFVSGILNQENPTEDSVNLSTSYNNEFYVDESIVTFNSPELEDVYNMIESSGVNFRLIGIAPITSSKSDYQIEFDPASVGSKGGTLLPLSLSKYNTNNLSAFNNTLISDSLYFGINWRKNQDDTYYPSGSSDYLVYMWHKCGSICGSSSKCVKAANSTDPLDYDIDILDKKIFGTERFSYRTEYFDNIELSIFTPKVFNNDGISLTLIDTPFGQKTYYGNYSKAIVPNVDVDLLNSNISSSDPVQIDFKSTPHVVISFNPHYYLPNYSNVLPPLESDSIRDYKERISKYSFIPNDVNLYINDNDNDEYAHYNCLEILSNTDINGVYTWALNNESLITTDQNNCVIVHVPGPHGSHIFSVYKVYKDGRLIVVEEIQYTNTLFKIKNNTTYPTALDPEQFDPDVNYHIAIDDPTVATPAYIIKKYSKIETNKIVYNYLIPYYQDSNNGVINKNSDYPYLFIGELYRNIPYESLYNGYDENALEAINWIPISEPVNIDEDITETWGDTYYQRWDCVKTLPKSNSNINNVVDITSIMVESHINLDGRYDRNRGGRDVLNVSQQNFNVFNIAYNQTDDLFKYNILDEKFDLDRFKNQIVWSNQKSPVSDVDTWTNINQLSSLYLNGEYGGVNKLVNYNDTIVAFQDKAIAAVKFNNDIQISTENGAPLEVINSGKVTGYSYVTTFNGCTNKKSICQTAAGLYFMDDLNKSFMRFNKDGLSNISLTCEFSSWFNDHTLDTYRVSADNINHDVYIVDTDNLVLCYNEVLESFTSFYPIHKRAISMFNAFGKSMYLLNGDEDNVAIAKMHDSKDYTRSFFVDYRVAPEPLSEKTFTNIEYTCDTIGCPCGLKKENPFKLLVATTEYQHGVTKLLRDRYPNSSNKFRIWRADIPRDVSNKLNRIQNPWVRLRLIGNDNITGMTTLHNLSVKYFK